MSCKLKITCVLPGPGCYPVEGCKDDMREVSIAIKRHNARGTAGSINRTRRRRRVTGSTKQAKDYGTFAIPYDLSRVTGGMLALAIKVRVEIEP